MLKQKVSPIPKNISPKEVFIEAERLRKEKRDNTKNFYELALYNVIIKQKQLNLFN